MKFLAIFFLSLSLAVLLPRQVVRAATQPVLLAEQEDGEHEDAEDAPETPSVPTPIPATGNTPTTSSPPDAVNINASSASNTEIVPTNDSPSEAVDVNSATPSTAIAPTISTNFPWAWITARATGIASFVLLGLLSATGILLTTGALFRLLSPAAAWSLHRAIGTALLFSVLAHIASLLLDHFINLRLIDLLVPFVSPYKTIFLALGIIGFYILLLVLTTSLYTISSHAKFWRSVHFFAFPMYVLIFLHSYLVGTDTKEWWMQSIYWGSAAIIGAAVIYRLIWKYKTKVSPPTRIS